MLRIAAMRANSLALLVSLIPPALAYAQPLSTTGRWVSQFEFKDPSEPAASEVAIHLAVLRGRSDSTHVLYFTHGNQTRLMLDAVAGAAVSRWDAWLTGGATGKSHALAQARAPATPRGRRRPAATGSVQPARLVTHAEPSPRGGRARSKSTLTRKP